VQSYVAGVPEVQIVDVSSMRVNELQTFGVIVNGVDTSSCTSGLVCSVVEAGFSGYYRLQFDPNQCGTYSDHVNSNWCVVALNDGGVTGYDCSSTSCLTPYIPIGASASAVQSALCGITGSGTQSFMTSPDGLCVSVNMTSIAVNISPTVGTYMIMYSVLFEGQFVRGNVPALSVSFQNVSHATIGSTFTSTYTNISSLVVTTLGSVATTNNVAFTLIEGNQPDGLFTLTYACERRTVYTTVNVTAVVSSDTSIITTPNQVLKQYEYIRIQQTYHQIILVDSTGFIGTIAPAFDLTPYAGINTFANAETGAFYSDPYDVFGVSAACYTPNVYITLPMNQSVLAADMAAKLRALSPVVVDSDDSLIITTSYYPSTSNRVGYYWTLTFVRQNGDVSPLVCGIAQLLGTNSAGSTCTITTVQNGTLIDGSFVLSVTSPNAYISSPITYTAATAPWNIDASSLATILSGTSGFGIVTVSRAPYFPTGQKRWSGCYLWTVSFQNRFGQVPSMGIQSNLTAAPSNASMTVGTRSFPLTYDDPGTAVLGNQVGGYFGFTFTDTNGTFYSSNNTAFSVISNVTGQAISATEFKTFLVQMLNGQDIVQVSRSAVPNAVLGYTYSIEYTGQVVGGNVQNLAPITTFLTHTSTASNSQQVGVICTNPTACTVGSYVVNIDVNVATTTVGAQLQGSFQLRFGSASTGALPYNAVAAEVESAINSLSTISPSFVKVSRFGPMTTPSTQVFGYVWEITFTSNTWIDPRVSHSQYVPGNWVGPATTWDAVWESGLSKAWGRQVGDQPLIECSFAGLYSTDGVLPANACAVVEVVKGTYPLSGTFSLTLDTLHPPHPVINIQDVLTTGPISFNAFANATESGGDGTSIEERLQSMYNVGDVFVSRGDVNKKTGGFTWYITFVRDIDHAGGQWNGQCEQKGAALASSYVFL
jgi:hypothetical protein